MKFMKTVALAALIAGSLFVVDMAVQAQDSTTNTPPAGAPANPRPRGANIQALVKQLDLTDDQKPQVKAVLDDQMQKTRDLREDSSLSPDDRRAKIKEIRDEANVKLKTILTPDQYAKWEKIGFGRHRTMTPPTVTPATTNAPAASN